MATAEHTTEGATKRCSRCKTVYPATATCFYRQKTSRDGLGLWCKSCMDANSARYRHAHVLQHRANRNAYQRRNKERHRIAKAKWRNKPAVKARILAQLAEDRRKNPQKYREAEAKRRKTRPEVYCKKDQRDRAMRAARKRAFPATWTHEEWVIARQYWHFTCAVCGRQEGFEWTIVADHWIPLASCECPGTVKENMVPLCHGVTGCNNTKLDKPPERWLIERLGIRKAARKMKEISAFFAYMKSLSPEERSG